MSEDKQKQIEIIEEMIKIAEDNISAAKKLLQRLIAAEPQRDEDLISETENEEGNIVIGIFNGQSMRTKDGKQYTVPANYASKSKLVYGDTLKLIIAPDGKFIYKQIKPVARKRVIGELVKNPQTNNLEVTTEAKNYQVLAASITYFKGQVGNSVVILVPRNKESNWAAIENIIKEDNNKIAVKKIVTPPTEIKLATESSNKSTEEKSQKSD